MGYFEDKHLNSYVLKLVKDKSMVFTELLNLDKNVLKVSEYLHKFMNEFTNDPDDDIDNYYDLMEKYGTGNLGGVVSFTFGCFAFGFDCSQPQTEELSMEVYEFVRDYYAPKQDKSKKKKYVPKKSPPSSPRGQKKRMLSLPDLPNLLDL